MEGAIPAYPGVQAFGLNGKYTKNCEARSHYVHP